MFINLSAEDVAHLIVEETLHKEIEISKCKDAKIYSSSISVTISCSESMENIVKALQELVIFGK